MSEHITEHVKADDPNRIHVRDGIVVLRQVTDEGTARAERAKQAKAERQRRDSGKPDDQPGDAGEPIPLYPDIPPAAPYPIDALGPLASAARAIASKVQAPDAIAANSVLGVASLATQGLADVQLPFGSSSPLSLFLVTLAASGDRKTGCDKEAMWGVRQREAEMQLEYEEELKTFKTEYMAWELQKKQIEKQFDKGHIQFETLKFQLEALGPAPDMPLSAYLTSGEPTVEGLVKHWADAPASLGLFSEEGGQLVGGFGFNKDNLLKTAATFSSLWNGIPVQRLRSGEPVTILRGRRLSAHIMIQPAAGLEFLANPVLRDQGFLARFLIAAPDSIAGDRPYREPSAADLAEIQRFNARILDLLHHELPLAEGRRNELNPPKLILTERAKRLWIDCYNRIEDGQKKGGMYAGIGPVAGKAAEQAARIAGVLTVARNAIARTIDHDAMENGIALMDWYLGEALRLAGLAPIDAKLRAARAFHDWAVKWTAENRTDVFLFRVACQFAPPAFRTKTRTEEVIGILIEHGWLELASKRPKAYRVIPAPA